MVFGKSMAQVIAFWIAVHPLGGFGHGLNCLWGWAEHIFIRSKARTKGTPLCPFLGFGAHKWHG